MYNIKLSRPCIDSECIEQVVSVLKSGWLSQGSKVFEFEDAIKKQLNIDYSLAVNSATSGLHIALLALGVGQGDEVIVPAFTWVATANVVELCGAKPVFVDIDLETFNTNPNKILLKITKKTKAIIIVHLFGKPFDVILLRSFLPTRIYIIEDAACALGARVNGNYCGTTGDVGVFSFHPRKSITTGEGGMVITKNRDIYDRMNMLRNHGQDTRHKENSPSFMFDCPIVGFNYRMTDFQAALGLPQLKKLNAVIEYRKSLAVLYRKRLSNNSGIYLPNEENFETHAWQSYVISVMPRSIRDEIMLKLAEEGVETRPGTHAVHTLTYYKNTYNLDPGNFQNAYEAFRTTISLPLHNLMTFKDVYYISDRLMEIIDAIQ